MSEKVLQNLKYICLGEGEGDEILGSRQSDALEGFQQIPSEAKHVFQTNSLPSFCIN